MDTIEQLKKEIQELEKTIGRLEEQVYGLMGSMVSLDLDFQTLLTCSHRQASKVSSGPARINLQ
jgi:hypothetical protein